MTTEKLIHTESIQLSVFLSEIYRCHRMIIVSTLICIFISIIYAVHLPKEYQSTALVQVEPKTNGISLSRLDKVLQGLKASSALDMTLLRSRRVIGAAVDELNLQIKFQPHYAPVFGKLWSSLTGKESGSVTVSQLSIPAVSDGKPANLMLTVLDRQYYKIRYRDQIATAETGKLIQLAGLKIMVAAITADPGSEFTISYHSRHDAINDVLDNLILMTPARNSDIIKITLLGKDQNLTRKTLDSILYNHVKYNIEDAVEGKRKGFDFLSLQIPIILSQLENDESALSLAKQQSHLVDLGDKTLSLLEQRMVIQEQINQILIEEVDISKRFSTSHPTYKILKRKQAFLLAEKAKLQSIIKTTPATQQKIMNLSSIVDVGSRIYAHAIYRQQQLKVLVSAVSSNIRIIDAAVDESESSTPNKIVVILQGMLLGVFISLTAILFRFTISNQFISQNEFERRVREVENATRDEIQSNVQPASNA